MKALNHYLSDCRLVENKRIYDCSEVDLTLNLNRGSFSEFAFLPDTGTWIENPVIQRYTGHKDCVGNKVYAEDLLEVVHYEGADLITTEHFVVIFLADKPYLKPIEYLDQDHLENATENIPMEDLDMLYTVVGNLKTCDKVCEVIKAHHR